MAFTVTQIVDNARDLYNGTGDTFFTEARMYEWLEHVINELARESKCIENTPTAVPTVAGTADYAYPTNLIEIKRLTYNGGKLQKLSKREVDAMTLSGTIATTQGTPVFYTDFDDTVSLFPVPDAVGSLVFSGYSEHATILVGTTISIPNQFQLGLVDGLLAKMYAKDKDFQSAAYYDAKFEKLKISALKYMKAKKRTDSFANVQVEELIPGTTLGAV
jgi:hypothetical protein